MKIYQRLNDSFKWQQISASYGEVAATHISPSLELIVISGNTLVLPFLDPLVTFPVLSWEIRNAIWMSIGNKAVGKCFDRRGSRVEILGFRRMTIPNWDDRVGSLANENCVIWCTGRTHGITVNHLGLPRDAGTWMIHKTVAWASQI